MTPATTTTNTTTEAEFDLDIEPARAWAPVPLKELWDYRELLYFLVWRDLKVRYKQTALGVTWAVLQPVFTMVVFSVFFGKLAKMPTDVNGSGLDIPYPLFSFAALVPWALFAQGLTQSADSLVSSAHLIRKVYFPRLVAPLASVGSSLVDFMIALFVLFGLMAYFGFAPTWQIVFLPCFVLLAMATALGVGLWLSALNVKYRDVKYTMGFLVQAWLFCTPIAYPSKLVPETWRAIYGINPMAGVVEGFRWMLLDTPAPGPMLWVSAVTTLLLLVSGLFYFSRMEQEFADVV